jgi:glycosyltransferase involved in cell wall biosynthesis
MKKNQKLLILAPHYNVFIKELTEELSRNFSEINVIILRFNPVIDIFNKKLYLFKSIRDSCSTSKDNISIHILEISSFLPFSIRKINKFISKNNIPFDFVLSHFLIPYGYLGNKVARSFNNDSIVIGHGFDVYDFPFRNFFFYILIKIILNQADKVITVSKSNFEKIKELGFAEKTIIIPNGFNPNIFRKLDKLEIRKKLNLPPKKKIIITVGNLVPVKNQEVLIKSMSSLLKKEKNVVLYIIGDGILKEDLQKSIDKKGLNNYVKLVGKKPHEEIALWMNAADLFVLSSRAESFGVVNIEALACGKPVVTTINGGSEEIISSEECGFLVGDPDDYEKFAEMIDKALKKKWNPEIIIKYSEKYTWSRVIKKFDKLF